MNEKTRELLHQAANILSARCDGAHALDGQGFNGIDTRFGKDLAALPADRWSPRQTETMFKMLGKYRGQLASAGFDFDVIPPPQEEEKRIDLVDGHFVVRIPSNEKKAIEAIKRMPHRRFVYQAEGNFPAMSNVAPNTYDVAIWLGKFVNRYPGFLGGMSAHVAIKDAAKAPKRPVEDKPKNNYLIDTHEDGFKISFTPFSHKVKDLVKEVPGRRFNKDKYWTAPETKQAVLAMRKLANDNGFQITDKAQKRMVRVIEKANDRLDLSSAADADYRVPGLGGTLYPFQKAGVAYSVENERNFIADEMGLGKTVQGLASIKAMNAFPAIVVCPASLKYNWEREAHFWLPGKKVAVLEGRNGSVPYVDLIILNYDIMSYYVEDLRSRQYKAVVFDESHYLKNHRAQRSQSAHDIVNGHIKDSRGWRKRGQYKVPYVWMLTGTPILSRPSEILFPLQVMRKLNDLGGWKTFTTRYCGAYEGSFGMNMGGGTNLEELNQRLRETGTYVRRLKKDVLKELPSKIWAGIPVQVTNMAEYKRVEEDTSQWFADRAAEDEDFLESIKDMTPEEQEFTIKERHKDSYWKAAQAEQLTKITALKQVAAEGKMKAAEQWIKSFLETGEKLVVFAYHRSITNQLAEKFQAPKITGETPNKKRQDIVDAFQTDPDTNLLVANIRAGGVGITLTAASNVLFLEFGWTPADMDQALDRVHRIGQEDSVTGWQMVGMDTIDEDIVELIDAKREVVNAATDGTDAPENVSILAELRARMASRSEHVE